MGTGEGSSQFSAAGEEIRLPSMPLRRLTREGGRNKFWANRMFESILANRKAREEEEKAYPMGDASVGLSGENRRLGVRRGLGLGMSSISGAPATRGMRGEEKRLVRNWR